MNSLKKKLFKRVLVFSLISLTLIFTGCSNNKESISSDQTIRVAFFPNINHAQALIGKAQDTFSDAVGENISIDWKMFNSGTSEIEAFFAGELDIGYIGPGPAINGFIKSNGEILIISGAADAGALLVSRKDLNINGIDDIHNVKISSPSFGNTQDLMLRAFLDKNNIKDSTKGGDVEIVPVKNTNVKTLMDRGDIDLSILPEPWGSVLINECGARIVVDNNDIWRNGKYPTTLIVVRKDFMEMHPDLVENFLRAHVEITNYINDNAKEAKDVLNGELEALTSKALDKKILDDAFSRIIFTLNPEKDAVIELSDVCKSLSFIDNNDDIENIFNLDILNEILED